MTITEALDRSPAIIAAIEDPHHRDVLDTLAGAVLRIFARLERFERRLAQLERPAPPRTSVRTEASTAVFDKPEIADQRAGTVPLVGNRAVRRGRGRPKGSLDQRPRARRNGADLTLAGF